MAAQAQSEYDFICNLICFVRERKYLYDKKDHLVKEKAWNDISIKVNKTSKLNLQYW